MNVQDYLAALQPSPEDEAQARRQSFMAMAAAMLGNAKNLPSALSAGITAKMGTEALSKEHARRKRMDIFGAQEQAHRLAAFDKANEIDQAKAAAAREFASQIPSPAAGAAPSADGSGAPQAPRASGREAQRRYHQSAGEFYLRKGLLDQANAEFDKAQKLEEEYSPEVRYDQTGRGFMTSKQGGIKYLDGIRARDKIVTDNLGGQTRYRTEFDTAPVGAAQHTPTPGDLLTDRRGREGLGLQREQMERVDSRARDANAISSNNRTREDLDGIRREFNMLPEVKSYKEVIPVLQSAKKASDTPQGDLALVYAVGKVLDPNSVVREGEMELVIKSGSLMERLVGAGRMNFGKGRISPEMRAKLTGMLEQRAGEYQAQYERARGTFEGIAKTRGYDPSQIFTETPSVQEAPPAPAPSAAPPQKRTVGQVYDTPKGKMKWMGNGWLPVS